MTRRVGHGVQEIWCRGDGVGRQSAVVTGGARKGEEVTERREGGCCGDRGWERCSRDGGGGSM